MAAWGSLKNLFETPLPDSLSSWSQLLPEAHPGTSFEMFGELCHRINPSSPSTPNSASPPPPPPPPSNQTRPLIPDPSLWNETMSEPDENTFEIFGELCHRPNPEFKQSGSPLGPQKIQFCDEPKSNDGFSPKNSGSLQLCTEGLGFESLGDPEDVKIDGHDNGKKEKRDVATYTRSYSDMRSRNSSGLFPPPITSIGRCGKPRVYFKSYRKDGRFVLREIRIPTQQLLHATRENGRLKMRVIRPDEEEEEEEEEKEEEKDGEERGEGEEERGLGGEEDTEGMVKG